ncbi:MAG TPA: NAD(P)H-hydrate dehydratase [Burkholderiales bacterium]|nr:NAD(P)H-hydrate dehydratase [Burkholderiales bacterium]
MTRVFLTDEIREIERAAQAHPATQPLMERAGLAVAECARELLGDREKRILLLAGPGNNGGDALVAARNLKQWWLDVTVVCTGVESKLPKDASAALAEWKAAGGAVNETILAGRHWHLVVDGLFGVGLERPLEGAYAELVKSINLAGSRVLAIDIPSGLHADSGRVLGCAVRAHHTLTFIGLKPGLLTLDGPDHAGDVRLDTLGLTIPEKSGPLGRRIESALLGAILRPRPHNSHKGMYGNVGILGGAPGMVGAALLAGRAALKLGAGRVYVGLFADSPTVDLDQPELMLRPAQDLLKMEGLDCIVCGPGLGQSQSALHALTALLGHGAPLVIDADALNLIASDTKARMALATRGGATLLTPHPAEAARLLGKSVSDIQRDRVAAARELAAKYKCGAVLKGNGSICALGNGDWYVNTTGNPGMATAGMGDVLAGIIAALVAQGAEPGTALLAGVHLHGLAADQLVKQGIGPMGLTASEVIDSARMLLNRSIPQERER